jgi:hypothetical protein
VHGVRVDEFTIDSASSVIVQPPTRGRVGRANPQLVDFPDRVLGNPGCGGYGLSSWAVSSF